MLGEKPSVCVHTVHIRVYGVVGKYMTAGGDTASVATLVL